MQQNFRDPSLGAVEEAVARHFVSSWPTALRGASDKPTAESVRTDMAPVLEHMLRSVVILHL